jgi:kynurenine formamidase
MYINLTLAVNPNQAQSPIAKMGHFGTHIDVMDKFSKLSIEYFFCNTILFDISHIRERLIEKNDLLEINIEKDDFLIVRSLWLADFGYASSAYHHNHPHFSDEAIDYLISKKIRFLGLDFPGP